MNNTLRMDSSSAELIALRGLLTGKLPGALQHALAALQNIFFISIYSGFRGLVASLACAAHVHLYVFCGTSK